MHTSQQLLLLSFSLGCQGAEDTCGSQGLRAICHEHEVRARDEQRPSASCTIAQAEGVGVPKRAGQEPPILMVVC